jgi:hypothetical protein
LSIFELEVIMDSLLFLITVTIALLGPIVAITYLRPILRKVLVSLCDNADGAEFWIRCAYILAISGTLTLSLCLGQFDTTDSMVEAVRRAMLLVLIGIFITVAFISYSVWDQVQQNLAQRASHNNDDILHLPGDAS